MTIKKININKLYCNKDVTMDVVDSVHYIIITVKISTHSLLYLCILHRYITESIHTILR